MTNEVTAITQPQYERALQLARAYGHEWGRWLTEDDQPATVEEIRVLAQQRHNAAHDYQEAPDYVTPGHQFFCSCSTCLRARVLHHECPAECGIMMPSAVSETYDEVVLFHTTITRRLSWLIEPDGSVTFHIWRPAGLLLSVRIDDSSYLSYLPYLSYLTDTISIHERHVDALREALRAVGCDQIEDLLAIIPVSSDE